jgi:hypothetical protein
VRILATRPRRHAWRRTPRRPPSYADTGGLAKHPPLKMETRHAGSAKGPLEAIGAMLATETVKEDRSAKRKRVASSARDGGCCCTNRNSFAQTY